MAEAWFFALLRVGFVLLGAWGAGRLIMIPVREGIWGNSIALTLGVGLALSMLLRTNAVLWADWFVPWVDGLFVLAAAVGAYDLWQRSPAVKSMVRDGILRWRDGAWLGFMREHVFVLLLLWLLLAVFIASLLFPSYSDAYFRAHFLVIEDMAVDGRFDGVQWILYYGYALGAMALFSTAAGVPTLYDMQVFHVVFLLLTVTMIIEGGRHFGYSRRASVLAALLSVTIIEVVVISRNSGYDMVAQFFLVALVFAVLDLRGGKLRVWETLPLALLMFAALSAKLYGAIGVGLLGLFALFRGRAPMRLVLSGVAALILLFPSLLFVWREFGSPLFPYIHDLYGGGYDGLAVPYARTLTNFLLYPFELTLRFPDTRMMSGPVFLALLPLLIFRPWRRGAPAVERDIMLFSLLFLGVWFWLPFTSLVLRYFLFPLFLLSLPAARLIDMQLKNPTAGTNTVSKFLRFSVLVLLLVHIFPATWYSSKKVLDTLLELRSDTREGSLVMLRRTYPWLLAIDRTLPDGATVYTDIGDYEPLRHRRSIGTYLKDRGLTAAERDYVVLLTSGTDSYIHLMSQVLTEGHPERYEAWKAHIRDTRTYVTTIEGRYEIYK